MKKVEEFVLMEEDEGEHEFQEEEEEEKEKKSENNIELEFDLTQFSETNIGYTCDSDMCDIFAEINSSINSISMPLENANFPPSVVDAEIEPSNTFYHSNHPIPSTNIVY